MKQNGKTRASLFRRAKILNLLLVPFAIILALFSASLTHAAQLYYVNVDENYGEPWLLTAEGEIAYCLQYGTTVDSMYYTDSSQPVTNQANVQALIARAYPVYNGPQLGILYLGDATYEDFEAYQATQLAIWQLQGTATVSYPVAPRISALATALINNPAPTLNTGWITIDKSSASASVADGAARGVYGPISISVNTGNTALDAAILAQTGGLTLSPSTGSRNPNFTFSAANDPNGAEATTITAGTYYINYAVSSGFSATLSLSSRLSTYNSFTSLEVIEANEDPELYQLLGIVHISPVNPSTPVSVVGETPDEPCEYNPDLLPDDPNCQPPCESNPDLLADDPRCTPDVPITGHISNTTTIILSSLSALLSASLIASLIAAKRLKLKNASKNRKITRIRL
jgi:hypothetical protein